MKENLFYQLMVLFGCLYYNDTVYSWLQVAATSAAAAAAAAISSPTVSATTECVSAAAAGAEAANTCVLPPGNVLPPNSGAIGLGMSVSGVALEALFVFLPYVVLRPWFPTTRLGQV